jgi:hypothetical protein
VYLQHWLFRLERKLRDLPARKFLLGWNYNAMRIKQHHDVYGINAYFAMCMQRRIFRVERKLHDLPARKLLRQWNRDAMRIKQQHDVDGRHGSCAMRL